MCAARGRQGCDSASKACEDAGWGGVMWQIQQTDALVFTLTNGSKNNRCPNYCTATETNQAHRSFTDAYNRVRCYRYLYKSVKTGLPLFPSHHFPQLFQLLSHYSPIYLNWSINPRDAVWKTAIKLLLLLLLLLLVLLLQQLYGTSFKVAMTTGEEREWGGSEMMSTGWQLSNNKKKLKSCRQREQRTWVYNLTF